MPFKDRAKQREYQRRRTSNRRRNWFNGKCCVRCGAVDNLEIDHIDPSTKVSHRVWSWTFDRMMEELSKCQVLCSSCHKQKTFEDLPPAVHGTLRMYKHRFCRCDLCRKANAEDRANYRKQKKLELKT